MKHSKDQRGITQLFVLLLAALLVVVVGVAVYNTSRAKQASVIPTPTPNSSSPSPSAQSDNALIIAAVKKYDPQSTDDTVGNITIVGVNAKGTGASKVAPSGYQFIAHKDNATWTVVYRGQEMPGKTVGEKYSLSSGWFSTTY